MNSSQPCFASLSVFCYAKYCFTFKPHGIKAYARVILVGPSGLEPPTSCLSGTRSNLLSYDPMWYLAEVVLTLDLPCGGDDGIRTHDPLLAGQVLSQLSYTPIWLNEFRFSPFFQDLGTVLPFPYPVSALSYLPVRSPTKYCRHCRA